MSPNDAAGTPAPDYTLLYGGRGHERIVEGHPESPTWIVNDAFDKVKSVVDTSMAAYHHYCTEQGLPHSYFLGLDILVTGEIDADGNVADIRPTILEGPCSNSNPACPYIDSYRLFRRAELLGIDPDRVEFPVHPTQILDKLIAMFRGVWAAKTGDSNPVVGILTRAYPESEEETAHQLTLDACLAAGLRAFRITPDENPGVENGKLTVAGVPIDVCYRRIERKDVAEFYGPDLAPRLIKDTRETLFLNPWEVDVLRSKAVEERCFRSYEAATGKPVSRPQTLIGREATPDAVAAMVDRGGYARKRASSMGGRQVFLHANLKRVSRVFDQIYGRYDGYHMNLHNGDSPADFLAPLQNIEPDTIVQQLRVIDSRPTEIGYKLAYDTRINVLFDPVTQRWDIVSGISRSVPMGVDFQGNSLITNVSAGAHIAPLFMGTTEKPTTDLTFGPLLTALNRGETVWAPD